MGHGWEGAVLKLFRAKDFTFTVTGAERLTEHFARVRFTDGGMLKVTGVHPTMWVRVWFANAGRPHQRGYTLVDPDPEAGTFNLDFAMHDGPACEWALAAEAGETIEATVQGSAFTAPDPLPPRMFVFGDAASLPAINSLLAAMPDVPATIWFETAHDDDSRLLVLDAGLHRLNLVPRKEAGGHLVTEARTALPGLIGDPREAYAWVACDFKSTRGLTSLLRKDLGVPKHRVNAMAYWR
ncbi:siderophore-interacting protein [Glycomyces tenuis]|uniref:siderophore-interacting protein n=1 Tax=Glycomyces tenuis TaxID=58116 RepID=UPI000425A653|nr:siderophore-interacting protein [Glycomyces tenuis]